MEFSNIISVEVTISNLPRADWNFEIYLRVENNLPLVQSAPFLKIRHFDGKTGAISELDFSSYDKAFAVCEKDEVSISSIGEDSQLLSIFWLDSSANILTLHSPQIAHTNPFTSNHRNHANGKELLIDPPIGFDNHLGMEMLIAIFHKSKPMISSLDSLQEGLRSPTVLIEFLNPWAAAFQCVLIPHKKE